MSKGYENENRRMMRGGKGGGRSRRTDTDRIWTGYGHGCGSPTPIRIGSGLGIMMARPSTTSQGPIRIGSDPCPESPPIRRGDTGDLLCTHEGFFCVYTIGVFM